MEYLGNAKVNKIKNRGVWSSDFLLLQISCLLSTFLHLPNGDEGFLSFQICKIEQMISIIFKNQIAAKLFT